MTVDYAGESKDYRDNQGEMVMVFALALLVVYLVLVAQFESMLTPAVVMVTVPLGIFGGLLGLWLTGQEMSIYSQIGMIMLIGMVTKNGILIVEFINQLRQRGEVRRGDHQRLGAPPAADPDDLAHRHHRGRAADALHGRGLREPDVGGDRGLLRPLFGDPGDPAAGARHLPSTGQAGRHDRGADQLVDEALAASEAASQQDKPAA